MERGEGSVTTPNSVMGLELSGLAPGANEALGMEAASGHEVQTSPLPEYPSGHGPQVKPAPRGSAAGPARLAAGRSAQREPGKQGDTPARPCDGLTVGLQPSVSVQPVVPLPVYPYGQGPQRGPDCESVQLVRGSHPPLLSAQLEPAARQPARPDPR